MAETITKQQQEAFIPRLIHNLNPSSQAIFFLPLTEIENVTCPKLMAQTAI